MFDAITFDAILVGATCVAAFLSLPVTVALARRAARGRRSRHQLATLVYDPRRGWIPVGKEPLQ